MRVPFTEAVVGPLVGGMIEVVRARIDGEFVEALQIEMRVEANELGRLLENLERTFDEIVILAMADADVAQVNRDGPQALVRVDFALVLILKDGHGPMADVIVQRFERAGDDAFGFLPGTAL